MNRSLPVLAVLLGLAGLVPFAVCGLGALANPPPNDHWSLLGLIAYGAVILAFLGGVHWGFGLEADSTVPDSIQRARFGFGVVPSLLGWVAMLIAMLGFELVALGLLVVSFAATAIVEGRGSRRGHVPRAYMGLRWVLSAVVVVILVTVLLVLILHGKIVLW